ncbi:DMT family transporter [Candidatus Bathyarchaeota archaeon]|nr:DMT family transporter [Candidatus Bathyarchaeota archaeon]
MIGELSALGAALCWTVSAVLYKEALKEARPIAANTIRCIGTGIFLITVLALTGGFEVLVNLQYCVILLACASGLIGLGIGDTLYLFSIDLIGVSRAVPITCTYPLFSLVWAVLLAGEHVSWQVVVAVAAIVSGIWLLSYEKEAGSKESSSNKSLFRGVTAALTTAIVWSVSITLIDLAIEKAPGFEQAFAINAIRIAVLMIFLLVITPLTGGGLSFLRITRKNVARLFGGGIIALGLGWFLLALSFMYIPEAQAVPISSTTPLFSTLSGAVFLREKVTVKVAVGSAIIVLGTFLIFLV